MTTDESPPKAEPVRLQIVIPSLHGAGAERFFSSLSHALVERGVVVEWLLLEDEVRFDFAGEKVVCDAYRPTDSEDGTSRGLRGRWRMLTNLFRIVRFVRRANRRFRPQATIVVPVVGELHYATTLLCWLRSLVGVWSGSILLYEGTMQSLAFPGATWRGRLVRRLRFHCLRTVDQVVAISRAVHDDLVAGFPVRTDRLRVIPQGLDLEHVRRQATADLPSGWPSGVPVVLAVGRLIPLKRHDLLIEAFERIDVAQPPHLVLAGVGPLQEELQKRKRNSPARDRIHLVGWVSNPFPMMRAADVFVLTSEQEAFGNVLVEAMTCGCPVVCFDGFGAPAEITVDGSVGTLVPMGDVEALGQAVRRWLTEPPHAEALAERGERRAAEFAIDHIAGRYLRLFDELGDP